MIKEWFCALVLVCVLCVGGSAAFSQDEGRSVVLGSSQTQLRADHFNSSETIVLIPDNTRLVLLDGQRETFVKVRAYVNGRVYTGWITRYYTDFPFQPKGADRDLSEIKELQRDLTKIGFYAGDINGQSSQALTKGINRFLYVIGETPVSVLSDEQRSKLATIADQSGRRLSTLRRPMTLTPQEIFAVQLYLQELQYQIGAADGIAGPKTRNAIKSYQRNLGGAPTGALTLAQFIELYRTATIRRYGTDDPQLQSECGRDIECLETAVRKRIETLYGPEIANRTTSSKPSGTSAFQPGSGYSWIPKAIAGAIIFGQITKEVCSGTACDSFVKTARAGATIVGTYSCRLTCVKGFDDVDTIVTQSGVDHDQAYDHVYVNSGAICSRNLGGGWTPGFVSSIRCDLH